MFRLNPFIRAGLSASVVSLAFPALADVNEETLVVTASATEQNVRGNLYGAGDGRRNLACRAVAGYRWHNF